MKKYYKNTKQNVTKIFNILSNEENPITVGEISRRSGLHKWTISRTLDVWMDPFVDVTMIEELEMVGIRMKLVSLKAKYSLEQILRGLDVKNNI